MHTHTLTHTHTHTTYVLLKTKTSLNLNTASFMALSGIYYKHTHERASSSCFQVAVSDNLNGSYDNRHTFPWDTTNVVDKVKSELNQGISALIVQKTWYTLHALVSFPGPSAFLRVALKSWEGLERRLYMYNTPPHAFPMSNNSWPLPPIQNSPIYFYSHRLQLTVSLQGQQSP